MILGWRLCRTPYAALDGEGARQVGGRWNSAGRAMVYLAEHPALAALEVLVHLALPPEDLPDDFLLLRVMLPDPTEAAAPIGGERTVGDAWLREQRSAVLRVASVLVPHSWNLLLNPAHRHAAMVRVAETTPFRFDPRLLRAP